MWQCCGDAQGSAPPAPRRSAPPARDDDRWEAQAPPRAARQRLPPRHGPRDIPLVLRHDDRGGPAREDDLAALPLRPARCGRTKATWSMFTQISVSFGVVHLRQLAIAASTQIQRGIIASRLAEPMPAGETIPMGALHGTLICAARPSPRARRPAGRASVYRCGRAPGGSRQGPCRQARAPGRHLDRHRVDGAIAASSLPRISTSKCTARPRQSRWRRRSR